MFSSYAVFLIPIVAILAWGAHGVVREIYKGKAGVAEAARGDTSNDTVAANRQVLAKLESIEARLASVEKTLNDIPS